MTISLILTETTTSVQAPVGETLELRLEDISTTGYRWTLQAIDPPIVVLRQEDVTAGTAPGGGGVRQFEFQTLAPGRVVLQFNLVRPWEQGRAPLKRYRVALLVR